MERIHAYLAHSALLSLLALWPGYAAAADRGLPIPLPSSGVVSRAVPSLLQPMVASLQQRLTQLEAEARDTGAALNQPGSSAPAIVSARFPHLAALARQTAIEARAVRDQARVERQAHLENTADRIAADNEAISRGMEEARSKAQQATHAANVQLLGSIIYSATQMKSAVAAMQNSASQRATGKAGPDDAALVGAGAAANSASSFTGVGAPAGIAAGGAVGAASGAGAAAGGAAGIGAGAGAGAGSASAGAAAAGGKAGSAADGGYAGGIAGTTGGDQQIFALQQQVQALQAQIAALQAVFKIAPNGAVTILSPTSVSVQAGTTVSIGAGQNISIQSPGTALVEGKGGLDLKGMIVKLNGGTKPLATVGSQVQVPSQPIGQVTTGNQTVLAP